MFPVPEPDTHRPCPALALVESVELLSERLKLLLDALPGVRLFEGTLFLH